MPHILDPETGLCLICHKGQIEELKKRPPQKKAMPISSGFGGWPRQHYNPPTNSWDKARMDMAAQQRSQRVYPEPLDRKVSRSMDDIRVTTPTPRREKPKEVNPPVAYEIDSKPREPERVVEPQKKPPPPPVRKNKSPERQSTERRNPERRRGCGCCRSKPGNKVNSEGKRGYTHACEDDCCCSCCVRCCRCCPYWCQRYWPWILIGLLLLFILLACILGLIFGIPAYASRAISRSYGDVYIQNGQDRFFGAITNAAGQPTYTELTNFGAPTSSPNILVYRSTGAHWRASVWLLGTMLALAFH